MISSQACVFENAITPAAWTIPSFASLLTGMHAFNHNQHNLPIFQPEPLNIPTLVESLNEAGYQTAHIYTNGILESLDYDFQEKYNLCNFDDRDTNIDDQLAIDTAVDWFANEANQEKELFMLLWLYSPHWPYQTQNGYFEPFVLDQLYCTSPAMDVDLSFYDYGFITYEDLSPELQEIIGPPPLYDYYTYSALYEAAYDANIKYVDSLVGVLVNTLIEMELYEDTMIIFTSDHGENMIDHEMYFNHSCNLYNSLIKVPLIMKLPKQQDQIIIDFPIRIIDILPTILDIIGIDMDEIDGKSLLPVINNEIVNYDDRPCISYLSTLDNQEDIFSIILDEYKLIKHSDINELYNIAIDPEEKENLAALLPDLCDALEQYLQGLISP